MTEHGQRGLGRVWRFAPARKNAPTNCVNAANDSDCSAKESGKNPAACDVWNGIEEVQGNSQGMSIRLVLPQES